MKIALTLPGMNGTPIDSNLPSGVPTGGLFDKAGNIGGTGMNILQALAALVIVIAVLFFLWEMWKGGWDIITSQGRKEKLHTGRHRVLYAIFGLLMVFVSFFILGIASSLFGVNLLPFLFK